MGETLDLVSINMWIMFLVVMSRPPTITDTAPITVVQSEFSTRDSCIAAVNFSKTRSRIADAWCVKK